MSNPRYLEYREMIERIFDLDASLHPDGGLSRPERDTLRNLIEAAEQRVLAVRNVSMTS